MTDILIGNGTSIILAGSGHSPTSGVALTGTSTHAITLASQAANAYRQSVKFDMGATRARDWICVGCIEWGTAPVAYGVVEFFIGFSDSSSAGVSNPGNLSGSDAAYVGYGSTSTDADEAIGQLIRIGGLIVSADVDTQVAEVGVFSPWRRYGSLVVRNGTSQAFIGDNVEMSVHLIPVVDQF